jgi:hypothetical protein
LYALVIIGSVAGNLLVIAAVLRSPNMRKVGRRPLVPFLLLGPPFSSNYSLLVHHPKDWDDRHLLACAMVSDFILRLL